MSVAYIRELIEEIQSNLEEIDASTDERDHIVDLEEVSDLADCIAEEARLLIEGIKRSEEMFG